MTGQRGLPNSAGRIQFSAKETGRTMVRATADLARNITWEASRQSYLTARLMVDSDLVDDAFRAYGYFRWVDDLIDKEAGSREVGASFIARQRMIVDTLYAGDRPSRLTQEEEIVADLIERHRENGAGLRSYITKMMDIMEFDVKRRDKLISESELEWYSDRLGTSVIDAILFFVGKTHPFSRGKGGYAAGIAAHMAHMLRDMRADISNGFVNIPREYLEKHRLGPADVDQPAYRSWVQERVNRTRKLFVQGRRFLDKLDDLRLRIVGQLYCARFDHVLATIEGDGFLLREDYGNRRAAPNWLRMAAIATRISLDHTWSRLTGKPSGNGNEAG